MSVVYPNFLFIGPDKSGSSWLYEILLEHPNCFVPTCKDSYYFDLYYHRGIDWYLSLFQRASSDMLAIGEISHGYLFSSAAVGRIRSDLPEVRLITSLRNPVDRCFSHYLYLVSSGLVNATFERALEVRPGLIRSSLYFEPLKRYIDEFGKSRILTLFFDELESDPRRYAHRVFEFLDIPVIESVKFSKKVRPARRARSFLVARLVKKAAVTARNMGLSNTVGAVKRSWVNRLLYRPYSLEEKPTINTSTRRGLLEVFLPDVERLEQLLEVDLSAWKN